METNSINEAVNTEWIHRYLHNKAKQILQEKKAFLDTKPVRVLPAGVSGNGKKWGDLKAYGKVITANTISYGNNC